MEYLEIKNPVWDNVEKTSLTADVEFVNLGVLKFTTSPNAKEDYALAIYQDAVAMGPAEYQPPVILIETIFRSRLAALRLYRRDKDSENIIFRGTEYAAGLNDQTRINNLITTSTAAGITEVDFKTVDDYKTITIEELLLVSAAMTKHNEQCFTNERVHMIAMRKLFKANDRDGLIAYDITTGWPGNIYD